MQPLVPLNFANEAHEADFRYGLVRVRENAEAVALYGGARSEARLLLARLRRIVRNRLALLAAKRNLFLFSLTYDNVIQFLPMVILARRFFAGAVGLGAIMEADGAFARVQRCLSLVVVEFERLAELSAVTNRLGEFGEGLEERSAPARPSGVSPAVPDGATIAREDVQGARLRELKVFGALVCET